MGKNKLIAKQQLEIESLKKELDRFKNAKRNVLNIIYCIGGPLNDNVLGYTNKQLITFFNITEALNV